MSKKVIRRLRNPLFREDSPSRRDLTGVCTSSLVSPRRLLYGTKIIKKPLKSVIIFQKIFGNFLILCHADYHLYPKSIRSNRQPVFAFDRGIYLSKTQILKNFTQIFIVCRKRHKISPWFICAGEKFKNKEAAKAFRTSCVTKIADKSVLSVKMV